MKIGPCFPYTQEDLSRELMLEWFRRVDEGPFSTLSCGERMVGSGVDMMATLAAVTTRVRIVPTLHALAMHPALKVAKHVATHAVHHELFTTDHAVSRPRRCIQSSSVARSIRFEERLSMDRMSRTCLGEPPSR